MEAAIYIIVLLHMKVLIMKHHLHLLTATLNALMRKAGAKRTKSGKIDVSCWMKTGFPPQTISSTVKDIVNLI